MIEVSDLSKSFGHLRALDRISFQVKEGEILGFLGPNGAGKTTTMRILTCFLPGDSGTVRVAGFDVRRQPIQVRSALGYLPEAVPLYPEMRVVEYLRFRARLKGIRRSQRKAAMDMALEQAGVSEARRRVIGALSRGYRQRVGVADALLGDPKVLILDEPTVGLDPEQQRQFRQLLREVGRDRTVVLSTHVLSEVEHVCPEVLIIDRGRVRARGTTAELRSKIGSVERTFAEIAGPPPELLEALRRDPRVSSLRLEEGKPYHRIVAESLAGEDLREMVYRIVTERGWLLRELRREVVSLEEVFVDVVKAEGK